MSKRTKIFLIISAGLIAGGLCLTGIGFALGGHGYQLDDMWVFDDWDDDEYDGGLFNEGTRTDNGYMAQEMDTDSFSSIEVDADRYNIQLLESTDSYGVKLYYKDSKVQPYCRVENGVLIIDDEDDKDQMKSWVKGIGRKDHDKSSIQIFYPKGTVFQEVDLDIAAGAVQLNKLNCQQLKLDIAAGDVQGVAMKTEGMDIEIAVGNVEMTGRFAGNSYLECEVGSVSLNNQLRKDMFSCDLKAQLGSVELDSRDQGMSYRENSMTNQIVVDCSLGSIEVTSGTEGPADIDSAITDPAAPAVLDVPSNGTAPSVL